MTVFLRDCCFSEQQLFKTIEQRQAHKGAVIHSWLELISFGYVCYDVVRIIFLEIGVILLEFYFQSHHFNRSNGQKSHSCIQIFSVYR